jgi:outer membrane receptor for ferrienterochelin and colicins
MVNSAHAWQANPNLQFSLKAEYRSERERFLNTYDSLSADEKAVYDAVGELKSYTVFHLVGRYKLSENTSLNATIYNVIDKDFLDGRELSGGYAPLLYPVRTINRWD